ncbi:MAG: ABC transporter permease [Clostridiales bacterium]|nr:ABC transporter permease [Clostridiales bacterium]
MSKTKAKAPAEQAVKKESAMTGILKRLAKDKAAMFGLILLIVLILACICAPLLTPYEPTKMDSTAVFATPSFAHPLGCDRLGRDMLSRMLYGGRFSLGLGLLVSLIGMVLGIFFGAIFGYYGGKVDNISMRVMDIWQAIPSTLLAILISTALGSGFIQTVIALTVGGIPGSIRGTRAMVLKEREMDYLEAARAMNCSDFKIIFKHMVPNVLSPTIVGTTMHIGSTIMEAASLSYIGLGVQPPTPEWGAILADGKSYILSYPHLLVYPGIAIALTVLAFNLFGDGLRDALDPRLKD